MHWSSGLFGSGAAYISILSAADASLDSLCAWAQKAKLNAIPIKSMAVKLRRRRTWFLIMRRFFIVDLFWLSGPEYPIFCCPVSI